MPSIVRIKRKQLGLTQTQLAQQVGCAQSHISDIESDIYGASPDLAEKIAGQLGISKEEVLYPSKPANTHNQEVFKQNRLARKQRKAVAIMPYPSAPRRAYAQRRLIIRCGRVVQVFSE